MATGKPNDPLDAIRQSRSHGDRERGTRLWGKPAATLPGWRASTEAGSKLTGCSRFDDGLKAGPDRLMGHLLAPPEAC